MSATSRRLQLSRTLFYANFRVNLLLRPSLFSSTSLATLAQWNGQPIRAWRKLPQLIFEVETNPATRWQPLAPSVCFGACQTITSASRRPPLAPRVQRPSRLFPLPDLLQGTAFPRGPLRTCLAACKLATIFVRLSSPILVVSGLFPISHSVVLLVPQQGISFQVGCPSARNALYPIIFTHSPSHTVSRPTCSTRSTTQQATSTLTCLPGSVLTHPCITLPFHPWRCLSPLFRDPA